MLVMIRGWKKVDKGVYGSDQKAFCGRVGKYVPLYIISKDNNGWFIKLSVEENNETLERGYCMFQYGLPTLKMAKEIVEAHFGVEQMETDFDKAMQ